MTRALWSVLAIAAISACGGDDSNAKQDAPASHVDAPHVDAEHVDSPKPIDAAPATVKTVSCGSATIAATITSTLGNDSSYTPTNTPAHVNDIIEFEMASDHNVVPDHSGSAMTDSGLEVGFGSSACLQFTAVGTFSFECSAHGFVGTVTVTN